MSRLVPVDVKRTPWPSVNSVPDDVLQRCGATPCSACSQDDDLPLMRQRAFRTAEQSSLPSIVREVLPSSGRPLEPGARAFFELRFGHDFSAVRVHADEQAARAAEAIDASAFTVGSSIWFGRGMYQPEATFGQRLLAHELAHTIQQRGRPATQRSLRVGAVSDAAEVTADRAADAVLAGESVPQIGSSGPAIRRSPKVSPVPNDPSRRIVEMDDGSRYRVTRVVDLHQDTKTIPGEEPGPSLTPHIDKDNVWLQADWCSTGKKGDYRGKVQVGVNLPNAAKAVLEEVGRSIRNGQDPAEAIRNAEIKPFASVTITQSKRFSVDLSGGPTIQPTGGDKVTGGTAKATFKIGDVEFTAEGQITQPPPGSGRSGPDVRVTGGLSVPLGGPEKVTCKRTFVFPKISYQCEKIVPEHEEPKKVPVTRRQTHYFYFAYATPEPAKLPREAKLDAEGKKGLRQALDAGYRIEAIRGSASPEGLVGPVKGFGGNQRLSEERAKAAETWINRICPPPSALSMRPGCFAEGYKRPPLGKGELYGASPEGTELKGKELADASVQAFGEEPAEEPRRTPDVMEELEKRRTPERQTDIVWPLLRRAEIDVSKPDTEIRTVTVSESATPMEKCPTEVISAAADDFDREPAMKK